MEWRKNSGAEAGNIRDRMGCIGLESAGIGHNVRAMVRPTGSGHNWDSGVEYGKDES